MEFQPIETAIINLLGNSGLFTVFGYQSQKKSAEIAKNKLVNVFYSSGDFAASAPTTDQQHIASFKIELTGSAATKADVATLQNETATQAQLLTALTGMKRAEQEAHDIVNQMVSDVWNILMDARNQFLGFTRAKINSRGIPRIQISTSVEQGGLVVASAELTYNYRIAEPIQGDNVINRRDPEIDVTTEINEDTTAQQGQSINIPGA
jgi:hypothetical protein